MKGMILAAGLGTRLRPFTDNHPKALYEYKGTALLEHAVNHLKSAGIAEIIINVHHFADQIVAFLDENDNFGCSITISDETGELLETGGGMKKAAHLLTDGDFIVRNADIISDLDLVKLVSAHKTSEALVTLAVRQRETSRYFLFDDDFRLCGWKNLKTGIVRIVGGDYSFRQETDGEVASHGVQQLSGFAFSGIQVINPRIFPLISETGKFSLTDLYLRLAGDQLIQGFLDDGTVWKDIGTANVEASEPSVSKF